MAGRHLIALPCVLGLCVCLGWNCALPQAEGPAQTVELVPAEPSAPAAAPMPPAAEGPVEGPPPLAEVAPPTGEVPVAAPVGPAELLPPALAEPLGPPGLEEAEAGPPPSPGPTREGPPPTVPSILAPLTRAVEVGVGPAEEEEGESLWIGADEYGQLADPGGDSYFLFYPLRYHGGFTATVKPSSVDSMANVDVTPFTADKIEIIKHLKNVLGGDLGIEYYGPLNTLVIKLKREADNVRWVKELLDVLDAPRKQVEIQAMIVEDSTEHEDQLGVDWQLDNTRSDFFRSGTGSFDIPGSPRFGANDFNVRFDNQAMGSAVRLQATLRAMEAEGTLNILSEPTIVVEVGQTARILVGQQVPISTKWTGRAGSENVTTDLREVGVRLVVSPLTVSEDTIRLAIWPEVSSVAEWRATGTIENPVLNIRSAATVVSVQDREYIKIGGLLSEETIKTEVKIPLLGDVPFLGVFFKNWRYDSVKRNLVIFITPRIIRGPLLQGTGTVPLGGF